MLRTLARHSSVPHGTKATRMNLDNLPRNRNVLDSCYSQGHLHIREELVFPHSGSRIAWKLVKETWAQAAKKGLPLRGPVQDTPLHHAMPCNDSIAKGVSHPFCLVFMWYRVCIAEIPLLWGQGAPPLRMLSKGGRLRKGGVWQPNWSCRQDSLAVSRHTGPLRAYQSEAFRWAVWIGGGRTCCVWGIPIFRTELEPNRLQKPEKLEPIFHEQKQELDPQKLLFSDPPPPISVEKC